MPELQVLKLMRREARLSEELRHLRSMCVWQAQQVFDRVRLIEIAPTDFGDDVGFDPEVTTLILGEPHALVARRSLEAMRADLSNGCEVVVAAAVHMFPQGAAQSIYSLRGYEEAERAALAAAGTVAEPLTSHLPVALAGPSWLRRAAPDGSLDRLLTDPTLLGDLSTEVGVGRAGVFFECVDYYGQLREDILELLPERADRVLEVGCARGHTSRLVADRLGCPVVGVELNREIAREAAERLDEVIVGDVLEVDIEGSFDVIIATDVLEHIEDTDAFLRRMRSLLAPAGRLILSVPNVGHYSVVADLVHGRWDYVHVGLLCVTHRRFFTRRSLFEAVRQAGFAGCEIHAQTTVLPDQVRELEELPGADAESLRTHAFLVACEL